MDVKGPGGKVKRGNKGSREKGKREGAHGDLGRRREDHQGQALSC